MIGLSKDMLNFGHPDELHRFRCVSAIPNDYWSGLNGICFSANYEYNIFSAICVKEPEPGNGYEEEVVELNLSNFKTGEHTHFGELTGYQFRDVFMNEENWKKFEASKLDVVVLQSLYELSKSHIEEEQTK